MAACASFLAIGRWPWEVFKARLRLSIFGHCQNTLGHSHVVWLKCSSRVAGNLTWCMRRQAEHDGVTASSSNRSAGDLSVLDFKLCRMKVLCFTTAVARESCQLPVSFIHRDDIHATVIKRRERSQSRRKPKRFIQSQSDNILNPLCQHH